MNKFFIFQSGHTYVFSAEVNEVKDLITIITDQLLNKQIPLSVAAEAIVQVSEFCRNHIAIH